MLGVGARKFIAEPAVESRRPREPQRPGWKEGEKEREREDIEDIRVFERERGIEAGK